MRSVTDTSMMFITPMPPTTSEITAISDKSKVSDWLVRSAVFTMLSMLKVKKSLPPWRSVSSRTMLSSAALVGWPSRMRTVMLSKCCWPNRRLAPVL